MRGPDSPSFLKAFGEDEKLTGIPDSMEALLQVAISESSHYSEVTFCAVCCSQSCNTQQV